MSIEQELESIRKANGGQVTPEAVVEYATNPNSALHAKFEWDDSKAAHKHRLNQAMHIIVSVRLVIPESAGKSYQAYVSLRQDRNSEGGYRRIVDVLSDADLRAALMAEAVLDMETFQNKYRELEELAEVFATMQEAKVKARKRGNPRKNGRKKKTQTA